jgi:PPM family protein phosphatase
MMEVLTASFTDVGLTKKTNQDSLCIKVAETSIGKVVLAVVCDGLGGLSQGELASASVIHAFSDWFEQKLPAILANGEYDQIRSQWDQIIMDQNRRIAEYGKKLNIQLGTTLTAMLLIDTDFMLIAHVGDSRVYKIRQNLEILTEDQTLVAREVKIGRLTKEQAINDPRRNVLLQCIGVTNRLRPDYRYGTPKLGDVYLLCSDGFRHKVTEEELFATFYPPALLNEAVMEQKVRQMVELNKRRQERDNITALLVKIG